MRSSEAMREADWVVPEPYSLDASGVTVGSAGSVEDPAHLARLDLERAAGGLTAAYAGFIAVMRTSLDQGHWAVPGIRSPQHWLTCFAGVSPAAASDVVRIASRAHELPHAITAFEQTLITFHQLAVIAKHVPAGYDADVTALAPHCDVTQLRRAVAKYPFPAPDPEPETDAETDADPEAESDTEDLPADPDPAAVPARLRSWFADDRYHLEFEGPIDQGECIEQALKEAKDHLFHATRGHDSGTSSDSADGNPTTDGNESTSSCCVDESSWNPQVQAANEARVPPAFGGPGHLPVLGDGLDAAGKPRITLADALVEAMTRSLQVGTTSVSGRGDAYRVLFHFDSSGNAWSSTAGALPPAIADKLTCDALLVPIGERDGVPVDVGRTQRIVPRRTRRLVEDRDHGCRFPGCGTRRYVEVHHVIHWRHGGPTDLSNLVSLCPFHHDRLHAGDYRITTSTTGGFEFRDQYGEQFGYRPPPDPGKPPPTEPAKPYERQSWEPLNLNWITFENTS